MFNKKYKKLNNSYNKSKLDQVLWFIENYLPQKKGRGLNKNFFIFICGINLVLADHNILT